MAQDRTTEEKIAQEKKNMEMEANRLATINAENAFKKHKDEMQALRLAAVKDEIQRYQQRANAKSTDKDGNEHTLNSDLKKKIDGLLNPEANTTHDFRSSMMSLLAVLAEFVGVSNKKLDALVAPKLVPLKHGLKNIISDVKDYAMDKIRGNPRVDIPAFIHDVKLTDDNKLDIKLQAADRDMNIGTNLPRSFETLVTLWLFKEGYEPDPNNDGGFKAINGNGPLTKERFHELKNDRQRGLQQFLETSSELEYRSAPTP